MFIPFLHLSTGDHAWVIPTTSWKYVSFFRPEANGTESSTIRKVLSTLFLPCQRCQQGANSVRLRRSKVHRSSGGRGVSSILNSIQEKMRQQTQQHVILFLFLTFIDIHWHSPKKISRDDWDNWAWGSSTFGIAQRWFIDGMMHNMMKTWRHDRHESK